MSSREELSTLLACPRCDKTPLVFGDEKYACTACKIDFPLLDEIAWLFADPVTSLAEWRSRLDRAVKQYEYDSESLKLELAVQDIHPLTRARLTHAKDAQLDQAKRLRELMQPLELGNLTADLSTYLALRTRLPADQGIDTYYTNIHRDWVWGQKENEASLELVSGVLAGNRGKTLVLGAGSCRLAYDLHRRNALETTVACDFNPLLLMLAQRVINGEVVELYEFPIAPRSAKDVAVLHKLAAPEPVNKGFHFAFGDALRPPFAPAAFDIVLTPWLIDVIPEQLLTFARRINRLLRPGGYWVNFGSLKFAHPEKSLCYSLEETTALIPLAGFADPVTVETAIPYMCSPHSRHAREETVVTFAAQKNADCALAKRHSALPEWLVKGDAPVPQLESFRLQSLSTRVYAFLMAMIDGKRNIRDMAKLMAEQQLMTEEEAEPAIRNFLIKMYEESRG